MIPSDYGEVTELYSYMAFFFVVFTFGMETTYFRYSQTEDEEKVYSNCSSAVILINAIFLPFLLFISLFFDGNLGYENRSQLLLLTIAIIFSDVFLAIPFARLRKLEKAKQFAWIKLGNIGINIGLNLILLMFLPFFFEWIQRPAWKSYIIENSIIIILVSNLLANVFSIALLSKQVRSIKLGIDKKLFKTMFVYALPLIFIGIAGNINEVFSRVAMKHLIPDLSVAKEQLGIFGANYKMAILINLFIQTFRYAAEPFFFDQNKNNNSRDIYAIVFKYFVWFCLFIFLFITLFLDYFIYFIGSEFRSGVGVVPILVAGNIFLGIVYNLSIWYKLINKTLYGAYIALVGSIITVVGNIIFVPYYGYYGAAWCTFACYFVMAVISYFAGQKHFKVNYPLRTIGIYFGISFLLFFLKFYVIHLHGILNFFVGLIFLSIFIIYFVLEDSKLRMLIFKKHGNKNSK